MWRALTRIHKPWTPFWEVNMLTSQTHTYICVYQQYVMGDKVTDKYWWWYLCIGRSDIWLGGSTGWTIICGRTERTDQAIYVCAVVFVLSCFWSQWQCLVHLKLWIWCSLPKSQSVSSPTARNGRLPYLIQHCKACTLLRQMCRQARRGPTRSYWICIRSVIKQISRLKWHRLSTRCD